MPRFPTEAVGTQKAGKARGYRPGLLKRPPSKELRKPGGVSGLFLQLYERAEGKTC